MKYPSGVNALSGTQCVILITIDETQKKRTVFSYKNSFLAAFYPTGCHQDHGFIVQLR